jgi:3-deoxy-manno-octulosonate cytidylyltransferase (CMP-KDO synthetase)
VSPGAPRAAHATAPRVLAIVPARLASTRYPRKPLVRILGKSMLQHVAERVGASASIHDVIVATCDAEIVSHVEGFGGTAVMTSDRHQRASDRCAEALEVHERTTGRRWDVVVMVQGDEPMTDPRMLDQVVAPFGAPDAPSVVNLWVDVQPGEFDNRNCVKVVTNLAGDALYMSRAPIPVSMDGVERPMGKQLGLIAFTADALRRFAILAPTPLEECESVDMMRFIEHGVRVAMVRTPYRTHAIDVPEDVAVVERLMSAAGS